LDIPYALRDLIENLRGVSRPTYDLDGLKRRYDEHCLLSCCPIFSFYILSQLSRKYYQKRSNESTTVEAAQLFHQHHGSQAEILNWMELVY
jgi:hypothetical protein